MPNYARPLHTNALAFEFLCNALDISEHDADRMCVDVTKAELLLRSMSPKSTLESEENRRPLRKSDDSRKDLRRKIFDELVSFARLDDDDEILLGKGGAKPPGGLKNESEATIITGLPASGKSSIANKIADLFGAYVVDSDYAKRKFPEFPHEFGASIVHEESSLVTFGSSHPKYEQEFNLIEYCISKNANMVIPKIGNDPNSLSALRDGLIDSGYKVHLVVVSLDRKEACKRALNRYIESKRYVPLGLIFDGYGNEPILTYYRTRDQAAWSSVAKISSSELKTKGPVVVFQLGIGPANALVEKGRST